MYWLYGVSAGEYEKTRITEYYVLSRTDKSTTPCNHLDTRVVRLPISARIGRRSGLSKRSARTASRSGPR